MRRLTRAELYGLEAYAEARPQFRARVLAHKRRRRLELGPHLSLHFEDRLTVQYQVQEMLRAERLFEPEAVEAELEAYNPLIPDGDNWKATLMLEYADPVERREALRRLAGVEDRVWVRVGDAPPVYAVADEDLPRRTPERTSAVHFLRFQLDPSRVRAARKGAPLALGVDHPAYQACCDPVPESLREALVEDLAADLEPPAA